jgi:hypothetical protein
MRNASEHPDRHGFTRPVCGRFTVTAVDGLFTNPAAGSPRRFCSPSCRQAAWRRRRAQVDETTPLQRHGGRSRSLRPPVPSTPIEPPTISTPQEVINPSDPPTHN